MNIFFLLSFSFENNDETVLDAHLQDAIKAFMETNIVKGSSVNLIARRNRLIKSTMSAITRDEFSFFSEPNITFSGEEAVDLGGPRREFFR